MSNKEEKYKEHKKKNKYIVKDKDGNILPIDIPDEFMDGLRAMLKEEQEKVKNRGRNPFKQLRLRKNNFDSMEYFLQFYIFVLDFEKYIL